MVASSGSTQNTASLPSTMPIVPEWRLSSSTGTPISAGMFIIRARIAVWEFVEPWTVTNARILRLSRSSATMMDGSICAQSSSSSPLRFRIRRFEISFTSAERACMYSSSIFAKISAKLSPVTATAYSALSSSVSIIEWIASW